MPDLTGYYASDYCRSLGEFGKPYIGQSSRTGFLKKKFSGYNDFCGQYPFVCTHSWGNVEDDLQIMKEHGGVSVVFVTDPFAETEVEENLKGLTLAKPFKKHFIVDLSRNWKQKLNSKKRNTIRNSLKLQNIRFFKGSREYAPVFWQLYCELIKRHNINGVQKLSEKVIGDQLEVEGSVVVEASVDEVPVGAMIWYTIDGKAYSHLHAQSQLGYRLHTNFALYFSVLEYFQKIGVEYACLGGVAGNVDTQDDGLANFKSLWADVTMSSWLCGEILDRAVYKKLVSESRAGSIDFFPAYRS